MNDDIGDDSKRESQAASNSAHLQAPESATNHSALVADSWTPRKVEADAPAQRRTTAGAASLFPRASLDTSTAPQSMSDLFLCDEPRSNSLRNEIRLLGDATDKAAATAAARGPRLPDRVDENDRSSRSFTKALPRHQHTEATAAADVAEAEPAAKALAGAQVHPIAMTDSDSGRQKAAPLSPNSLKRAASVYVTPTSTSRTLMKRQDSLAASSVSRSQVLWTSEATRRSSRMLDEWKRKEIWHDFKRAEENVSGPQAKKALAAAAAGAGAGGDRGDDSVAAAPLGGRLESLLHNLRAEISSPFQTADRAARSTPPPSESAVTSASAVLPPGCSRSEFEQVLQEKRLLADELEKRLLADELEDRTRASATDKEILRSMSDRVQLLEGSERENKFLKDEIQRLVMQELVAKEQFKTLSEQLTLTVKSEEQLKLQTQQLFQQNQSLQSDLLEKIAAEASKIQRMAHLSAEKERLVQELARGEATVSKRRLQEREQLQQKSVRRLLRVKRLSFLRAALATWHVTSERTAAARSHAVGVLVKAHRVAETKALATAFHRLRVRSLRSEHQAAASELHASLAASKRSSRTLALQVVARQCARIADCWRARQQSRALQMLRLHRETQRERERALELGLARLGALAVGRARAGKQSAFARWKARAQLLGMRVSYEKALRGAEELRDAKDCVFSLSREKTRLEDKLQRSRDELKRQAEQLSENSAELRVVKHGYVTTVLRDLERRWLRGLLSEWRLQTVVSLATRDLQLQSEMAELKAAERDKYARTVDDYNRVLRGDLERFQFFSQDKRIAVDVLTKKLLREEDKFKQMEERHVLLEEREHSLRTQLTAFVEWDGLELPPSMLLLSKDMAVRSLNDLFLSHATATPDPNGGGGGAATCLLSGSDSPSARLSMDSLLRMIEYSTLPEVAHARKEGLHDAVARHFPDYAAERGVLFPDFVTGLNNVLQEALHDSASKSERAKAFWASLLALVDPARWDATGSGAGGREHLIAGRSPWAGRLSDDILQNQEKLLAVLEHETAVVERAVMEKSSLKHTYPASDHATVTSTFFEYQCDPMLPPEPSTGTPPAPLAKPGVSASPSSVLAVPAEIYANWYQSAQVRDLFLAFHAPLLKVLVKYSNDTRVASHGDQYCLQLHGVLQMLEDVKLHPAYLSRDAIHATFAGLCDRDGYLTPSAFTLFLGACALELYARSLAGQAKLPPPAFPLSAREILLSFFCDLGFLAESAAPPPSRICFVGIEIETILWSLFEYYASSPPDERADDERVAMSSAKFARFLAEIAGSGAGADDVYRRVCAESRRAAGPPGSGSGASTTTSSARAHSGGLYFDDFYSALAYVQEARNAQLAYPSPGEAVRHWMQQTQ
ncbi:hypothetical protein PybrP1_002460 [[Pythium] brassicae (nom. inval.)]|nr:hypothetical protein PybrP1_002460 [[Pythium] brassicae (nom. inval.)]